MTELRWAPPERAELPAWERLLAAAEAVDARGEVLDAADLADEWASVWSDPEQNAVFVWDGDELVAFGWLRVVPGTRTKHKITLWGAVHPVRRGAGIGRALLQWQVERARKVAAAMPASVPVLLEVEHDTRMTDAVALARRFGFDEARWFVEVQRPLDEPIESPRPLGGLEVRPWEPGLSEPVRVAHADAFADHWGSEPRSAEEWDQWYAGHRNFRPDLSFVALDRTEVAGFVLCAAYPQDWEANGYRDAWVNLVGTRRPWRGRGVARALLLRSLEAMADAPDGFERATLGVDAENSTGALGLYERVGFREVRRSVTLQRPP